MSKNYQYYNRELSWLDFNERVLDQAADENIPLLERLKFLAISASNLDEFFMVRVGGLQIQAERTPDNTDIRGWSPAEQLDAIRDRVLAMVVLQYEWLDRILDALSQRGVKRLQLDELSSQQRSHHTRVFEEEVSSVISPIAVDDVYNFPAMIGATNALCVRLEGTVLGGEVEQDSLQQRFVVLPMRRGLSRIWTVPSVEGVHFVLLEDHGSPILCERCLCSH